MRFTYILEFFYLFLVNVGSRRVALSIKYGFLGQNGDFICPVLVKELRPERVNL